jgi:hypothetical protein
MVILVGLGSGPAALPPVRLSGPRNAARCYPDAGLP